MKYRKKPVVIDAVQWKRHDQRHDVLCNCSDKGLPHIHTLEEIMTPAVGDWIIKGVNGEFYSCKPDIFEKTYEAVED